MRYYEIISEDDDARLSAIKTAKAEVDLHAAKLRLRRDALATRKDEIEARVSAELAGVPAAPADAAPEPPVESAAQRRRRLASSTPMGRLLTTLDGDGMVGVGWAGRRRKA